MTQPNRRSCAPGSTALGAGAFAAFADGTSGPLPAYAGGSEPNIAEKRPGESFPEAGTIGRQYASVTSISF